jgi:hypothetical protein
VHKGDELWFQHRREWELQAGVTPSLNTKNNETNLGYSFTLGYCQDEGAYSISISNFLGISQDEFTLLYVSKCFLSRSLESQYRSIGR